MQPQNLSRVQFYCILCTKLIFVTYKQKSANRKKLKYLEKNNKFYNKNDTKTYERHTVCKVW